MITNILDKAYVAGCLDCDGCIQITIKVLEPSGGVLS